METQVQTSELQTNLYYRFLCEVELMETTITTRG